MEAIYEVPVIPNNLRHEETIVQIADVLNYLCKTFDDIITKVNNRIDQNKSHLQSLTQRINQSKEKITKLTGTKKATQLFSSSKYPATDVHKRYKSIFTADDKDSIQRTKVKLKNPSLIDEPLEKLQFYHVKVNDKYKQEIKSDIEGLGSFPNDIESINELILFNTSKNPYKNYVMSDPLQAIQVTKDVDESSETGPDAAPLSIRQRAATSRPVGENFFYSPGMGDVPVIDVPLDLPDLPGVADDLRYVMESGPGIAPSATTTPIVPDLPSIVQSPTDTSVHDKTLTESLPLPPLPIPSVVDIPLPATSTPTVLEPKIISVPEQKSPEMTIPVATQPPTVQKPEISVKAKLPEVENARASLMAAIRQAGGAKKAKLRNTEGTSDEKPASTGNLMDDLNAKLALRRKGISGSKGSDKTEMNSVLNRVSAMIPPPDNNELNESTNTEDEEWDE